MRKVLSEWFLEFLLMFHVPDNNLKSIFRCLHFLSKLQIFNRHKILLKFCLLRLNSKRNNLNLLCLWKLSEKFIILTGIANKFESFYAL